MHQESAEPSPSEAVEPWEAVEVAPQAAPPRATDLVAAAEAEAVGLFASPSPLLPTGQRVVSPPLWP